MKTILVVDYEIDIRSLVKEELGEVAYKVLAVATDRDAIEILKNPSLAVNLLIIDPCRNLYVIGEIFCFVSKKVGWICQLLSIQISLPTLLKITLLRMTT